MINDVEHSFMCLLAICISSLEKLDTLSFKDLFRSPLSGYSLLHLGTKCPLLIISLIYLFIYLFIYCVFLFFGFCLIFLKNKCLWNWHLKKVEGTAEYIIGFHGLIGIICAKPPASSAVRHTNLDAIPSSTTHKLCRFQQVTEPFRT